MRKIELEITGLSHTITQSQSYAVLLAEVDGVRKLPIVIGAFEAQAIAVAIEKLTINRPLSHDLIKNIFTSFQIQLKEILIDNLQDGIFYSKLICEKDGQELDIDSRTSDALALAVRFNCPIYTYEFILDSAGTVISEDTDEDDEDENDLEDSGELRLSEIPVQGPKGEYGSLSVEELRHALEEALSHEEYEKAAKIRDELEKRSDK
jgi:bifunctional DNase/RNase